MVDVIFVKKEDERCFYDMVCGMWLYFVFGVLCVVVCEVNCLIDLLFEVFNCCVYVYIDGRIVGWVGFIKGFWLNDYMCKCFLKEGW